MIWLLLLILWLLLFGLTRFAYRRGRLRSPWHRDVAGLGLLALAALGFFWRIVVGQNWMPADGGDLVSFLFPTYRYAAATLREGAWPLWNAGLYGGAPHVGDIQAGFLYPPNLLLFLLNPKFDYGALQWLSIGHIWFAGAGMYLLLARGIGLRRVAALSGALAFMFSDAFLTHFGNLNLNTVASWLPWVFWVFSGNLKLEAGDHSLLVTRYSLRYFASAALAGVLLGIATLAGHIQVTLFIVLALVVYAALWLWLNRSEPQPGRRAVGALVSLSTCFFISLFLVFPILLPTFQLTGYTARAGWDYTQAAGYSFAPAQWIGWLIPGFFGRGPQFHWGAWPRVEIGYVGILPLILAGLALALRRDRRTWVWLGLAVISFVLALGIYAIPHGWLTQIPGFGLLRAPARFVLLTGFALAVLAALGLDATLRPLIGAAHAAFGHVWRLVAGATAATLAIGVPLAYLALLLSQSSDPTVTLRISITLIAVVTFAGLLLASLLWLTARRGEWARRSTLGWLAAGLILLDLASLGAYQDLGDKDPSQGFAQPAITAFLNGRPNGPFRIDTRTQIETLWQPDTALLHGLEDIGGVANPLALADATRYWEGLGSRSSRLYDLLNVRYVIAKKDVTLDWAKFALVFDGDARLNVYENRSTLPRAFFVSQIQPVASHEEAWTAIHASDFDPAKTAVVEGPSASTSSSAQVTEIVSAPNRLTVRVDAAGPALLVLSQVWYPGWRVAVDGQPQGVPLRVNYLFQGVPVEAGSHTVELRFTSLLWRVGWVLAGVVVAALIAGAVFSVLRRR